MFDGDQQGPFATFTVDPHMALQWSGIKFSNDGKYILLPTTESPIYLIDAFTGKKVLFSAALCNHDRSDG